MSDTIANLLTHNAVGGVGPGSSAKQSDAPPELIEAAQNFESIFLSQFLETMTKDLQDGAFGGGDNPLTDMIKDEYAKMISKSGGIGVGDAVLREMLKMQEIS